MPTFLNESSSILVPILSFGIAAITYCEILRWRQNRNNDLVTYEGYCHCRALRFRIITHRHLWVWKCNCSICDMKKNWHFMVPEKDFTLYQGAEYVTDYKFNTKTAKHMFCKICGVQAFYRPRSHPDSVAVTLACIPADQLNTYEIHEFDGKKWEEFIKHVRK